MVGSAVRVGAALVEAFREFPYPVAFRLWDGVRVESAATTAPFAIVVPSPAAMRRVLLWPSPKRFGEAYVDGALDLEGDLFAALRAAQAFEGFTIGWRTWLRAMWAAWRR